MVRWPGWIGLVLGLVVSGGLVTAQGAEGRPAAIVEGSCASPGELVYELTSVGAETNLSGTPIAVATPVGSGEAVGVAMSVTTIEVALGDLVESEYSIAIYASEGERETMVACGAIGGVLDAQMAGMVMAGDELIVGLAPVGDQGVAGLTRLVADGASTQVTIYVIESAE